MMEEWEPTPADVIHIQDKALDEKAQTIYRMGRDNERLRAVNADLLAACKVALTVLESVSQTGREIGPGIIPHLRREIAKAKAD